jgi:DoxX-like family
METRTMEPQTMNISKARLWGGRVLSTLAVLFLVMDGSMKLFRPPFVVQATVQLGYHESAIVGIGITLLVCTALYLIPRTAVFGAILLTGYLGGAVASNIRAGTPVFNTVFPILFALLVWTSLVLRDRRLESIIFQGRST